MARTKKAGVAAKVAKKGAFKPNVSGGVVKVTDGGKDGKRPSGGAPFVKKPYVKKPFSPNPPAPMGKLSSRERREAKQLKNSTKKNYDIIHDSSQLWEAMRCSKEMLEATTKDEQVRLILEKIQGKVLELANHHTASRIIQFLCKHGDEIQRKLIMGEVQASMFELAKSKYGHHLVRKLINVSKKDEVPALVSHFKGHIAELLRHPYGADVLMDLYDVASSLARTSMCAELYGREFVLFSGTATTNDGVQLKGGLKELLEHVAASKRRSVLQSMTKALTPVMEKSLLHPPMVHRLLREFLNCAPGSAIEDSIDTLSLSGANVLKMVHTHDGGAVCCMLLAYGSARDRKRLVKAMKGLVREMATNEWGHAVLCVALSVVDDTAMMHKAVLSELKVMLEDACLDPHAHRVILQLLSPDNRHYLTPAVLELMHPPQRTVKGTSGKMVTDIEGDEDEVDHLAAIGGDDEDDGEELFTKKSSKKSKKSDDDAQPSTSAAGFDGTTEDDVDKDEDDTPSASVTRILGVSKKEPVLRRKELLGKGAGLGQALLDLCSAKAGDLLRSSHGINVLHEVVRGGDQGVLVELSPEGVSSVHNALIDEVARDPETDMDARVGSGEAGPSLRQEHVMVHYYGSRALRRMVLASVDGEGPSHDSSCSFVEALWSRALQGNCKRWMDTHGMKVLASLLHCGSASVKAAASKELKELVKGSLEAWSKPMVAPPASRGAQAGGRAGQQAGGSGVAEAGKQTAAAKTPNKKQANASDSVPASAKAAKTPNKKHAAVSDAVPASAKAATKTAAPTPSKTPKSAKRVKQ